MSFKQINTYPFYDTSWSDDGSVPPPVSGSSIPGYTWVSLNWTAPSSDITNFAGYVVCRSAANAKAGPTKIGAPGSTIVYVGDGNHFGDQPLTYNTYDILTADAGLIPNTVYYYSVFVVTVPPPQPEKIFPDFTPGKRSAPLIIYAKTTDTPPANLVKDGSFATIESPSKPTDAWQLTGSTATIKNSSICGGLCVTAISADKGLCCNGVSCVTSSDCNSATAGTITGCNCPDTNHSISVDTNDPTININGSPLFTQYMTLEMPVTDCDGTCSAKTANQCCPPRGRCAPNTEDCPGLTNAGNPCGCSGTPPSSPTITQTITFDEELIPGTLYSFSVWYRSNNPITAAQAVNGNDQAYTPIISVYGNESPSEPSSNYGYFQSEQFLVSQPSKGSLGYSGKTASAVACSSTDDSTKCVRDTYYSKAANYLDYTNFTGLWQQAALTFTIGSKIPSIILDAYNGGTPVQSPGTTDPSSLKFKGFTISIEVPSNIQGNPGGYIDFAKAELYEGPLPYTDPFWYINQGNLIYNPNFWGVQTETQGTLAPGWNYLQALAIVPSEIACGPTCSGIAMMCLNGTAEENCTDSCTPNGGVCNPTDLTCSNPLFSCTGNCSGTCAYDPTVTCTAGTGTCSGTCSMEKSICTGGTGTCEGTCTGECNYTEPTCKGGSPSCAGICSNPPGACACMKESTTSALCLFPDGTTCNDNYSQSCQADTTGPCSGNSSCEAYKALPICSNNSGTCLGSCSGKCTSTCNTTCPNTKCSDQSGVCTPNCTGYCEAISNACLDKSTLAPIANESCDITCKGTCSPDPTCVPTAISGETCDVTSGTCTGTVQSAGNGAVCTGGVGNCAGAAVCFDTTNPLYKTLTNSSICGPNQGGTSTYLAIQGCKCQDVKIQQGNMSGPMGWYIGSFSLEPKTQYTLSFDLMLLNNDDADNTLGISITDMSQSITIYTTSLKFDTTPTTSLVPLSTPFTFTTPDIIPYNMHIQLEIYKENLGIGISNMSITATGNEIYGIQNPYPAIMTVPSTTKATVGEEAILWRVPSSVDVSTDCAQCVLFNKTATTADLSLQLGWPQGLTLLSSFSHTDATWENFSLATDSDSYLQSTLGFGGNQNIMQITVDNLGNATNFGGASSFIQSNSYYSSGQWDIWVKLAKVVDATGNTVWNTDPNAGPIGETGGYPADPMGCTLAFWIFHGLDYGVAGGPRLLNEPSGFRNTEIDIEMNGDCPDYSFNFTNSTGRLNGWGGQFGGDGTNFTMHTPMPNNITLQDGKYHKLSILYHAGVDPTPDEIDPNATYPTARIPGFVKWFVDDIEWGCGWTGNTYGLDNVPMTATRMIIGPWNSDWAGCSSCCGTSGNCNGCTGNDNNCCKGGEGNAMGPTNNIPLTPCVQWDHAIFNIAQIQFTPTCTDCTLPTPPGTPSTYTEIYNPAAALPNRPDASVLPTNASTMTNIIKSEVNNIAGSNRNRRLPESKSYIVFPPTACDGNGNCCNGELQCTQNDACTGQPLNSPC